MMAFGGGEVIGGFIHGQIIDRIGSKKTVFVNVFIVAVMGISACVSIAILEYNITSFLMCFFWGWNDGCVNTFLYQIFGFEFDNPSDAFGAWNFWQGISIFVFQLIQSQVGVDDKLNILVYSIALGVIAIGCHIHAYWFPYKPHVKQVADVQHSQNAKVR